MKRFISLIITSIILLFSFCGCSCSHNFKEATCTSAKTCIQCGYTIEEPIGHNFVEATFEEPTTCMACGETSGSPLSLNDYGFNNMYEKNIWVPIIGYNFSENYVKVPTYNGRYLEFFDKYFRFDSGHPSEMISGLGQIKMKDPSISTYSIVDNDVIEYNGARGVGPWMITERVVEGKRLIIKTLDETPLNGSRESWFVLADSLDLSNIVEGDEKGYYYIYFKL